MSEETPKPKHSPLPWNYDERVGCVAVYAGPKLNCLSGSNRFAIYYRSGKPVMDDNDLQTGWLIPARYIANAHFIVLACNSHYELMEACKSVADRLEAWADDADARSKRLPDGPDATHQINLRDNYGFLIHLLHTAIAKTTQT